MNYIGSKYSLLPFLENVWREVRDGGEQTACDIFAGTGAVGRMFKRLGLRVIANDFQTYAYTLNRAYLVINQAPRFARLQKAYEPILDEGANSTERVLALLNRLEGMPGFIYENYGPAGNRFYYSAGNAERADAIRQTIESWREQRLINEDEYFYLLTSLLEAIDQVANTASVYGAFLKKFKATALRPLTMKPLELCNHVKGCEVHQRDANELIREIECDVLYLDPPYNHRQYGANYHVLETVAAYDNPQLSGVTGMRDYPRSRYCQSKQAAEALEDLITHTQARHILLSYNDEGVLSLEEIKRILSLRGELKTFEQPYNRFKADSGREYKRNATVEFVHYVRVTKSAAS
ncbi:MAG: DNA adenine methylase [Acidobacteria bacterium]|nr:DNA adenine methylase [Acidobacteriota bacterium]